MPERKVEEVLLVLEKEIIETKDFSSEAKELKKRREDFKKR